MSMSWGNVAAQGLLGAVMGGAQAVYKNSIEEQKAEMERQKEERLSALRMREYREKSAEDIKNIPLRGEAETGVKVKAEEAMRPGVIETARQRGEVDTETADTRDRNKRNLDIEYGPDVVAQKTAEEEAVGAIRQRRELENIGAREASSIRIQHASAEEARRNHWSIDEDGFYVDGDGNRITRSQQVEGRTVTVQVKAPKNKVEGKQEVYSVEDQVKAIDKEILIAIREGDKDAETRLKQEKRDLLSGKKPTPSQPWQRKWTAN